MRYGDLVCANVSRELKQQRQKAQNRGLKVAMRVRFRERTNNIHARAKLNILEDRLYAHQVIEGYRRSRITKYLDQRNLHTRAFDGPILKYHTPNSVPYTRSIEFSVAQVWNELDPGDRTIETLEVFRGEIKQYLIFNIPVPHNVV